MNRIIASLVLVSATCRVTPLAASPVTIATVPIGDVGNANDSADGDSGTPGIQNFGAVPYAYNMATTEVTVGQYTAFLNAVAGFDQYGLYDANMATNGNIAGIARSGNAPNTTYSVIGSPDKPVTYVNWGDAARFANWLNNGQPTGAEGPGTTETGAYTMNGATNIFFLNMITRNADAKWVLPSENEWYKAAYYDPRTTAQGGPPGDSHYWSYPTQSNSTPYSVQPPGIGAPTQSNTANFFLNDSAANGYNDGFAVTGSASLIASQNYLTNVGAYTQSSTFYGTFDQGGNVKEWNEALIQGSFRGFRGSAWDRTSDRMLSSFRDFDFPNDDSFVIGFRVASVPEPSSFLLVTLGLVGLAACRWRRRKC